MPHTVSHYCFMFVLIVILFYSMFVLIWGSLCNCRHPGPRRVWDGGSEPRILPPLPRLPWLPRRVPKTQILLLYAILESSRPPSEIWFWTTLHHFWHTRSDFEQPSINFEGWPLGEPKAVQGDPKGSQRSPRSSPMSIVWNLNLLKSWFLRFPGSIWVDMGWYSVQMNRIPII